MVAIAVVIVGIAAATQIDPSYSPGAADVRPQSTTCFSRTHASLLLGTASQSFQLFLHGCAIVACSADTDSATIYVYSSDRPHLCHACDAA